MQNVSERNLKPRPNKNPMTTKLKYQTFSNQMANVINAYNESESTVKRCSAKRVENLQPILLKDLQLNKIHTGCYLLCRTIENPIRVLSISTLIQDECDDIENIYLYNFSQDFETPPEFLLPKFSILLIKEPYLSPRINEMDELVHIRIDSLTDVVVLSDLDLNLNKHIVSNYDKYFISKWMINNENRNSKFERLILQALGFFDQENYYQSVRYYTKALNLANQLESGDFKAREIKKAFLNRSVAYLKLEKYFLAYEDAIKSESIEYDDVLVTSEALFGQGQALYFMRQYVKALDAFEKCFYLNRDNINVADEINRTKMRIKESQTGLFDIKSIIEKAKYENQRRLDIADFVHSEIEVVDLNYYSSSKGVVAKNDIKQNTLLVVSKASSITYSDECTENNDVSSHNLASFTFKVFNDPFLAKEISKLYSGPNLDRSSQKFDNQAIDTARLDAIIKYNSYISTNDDYENSEYGNTVNFGENEGIWVFPSFFNHSCLQNTKRIFYSDMMMIYSKRGIKKGEELTVNYVATMDSYKRRREICSDFGFTCLCNLCEKDRNDENLEKREQLIEEFKEKVECGEELTIKDVDKFVEIIRETYNKHSEELRVDLIQPLLLQAEYHYKFNDLIKAANIYMNVFEIFENVDEYAALYCLYEAAKAYYLVSSSENVKKCIQMAKDYFIGDKEHNEYICRCRLDLIENLCDYLSLVKI